MHDALLKINSRNDLKAFLFLILCTIVIYVPTFFHFLELRETQIKNSENPITILPAYGSDSTGYEVLSDNLIKHQVFSISPQEPFIPDTFRTPGFPMMIAPLKILLDTYIAFPLIEIIFTMMIAVLIYKVGEQIFSNRVSLVAALLFIIDPTTLLHSMLLLSDLPFAFLFLLSIYLLFFSKNKSDDKNILLSGLILGFSILVRPIAMYSPIFLVPFYILTLRLEVPWKIIAKKVIIFLIATLLILTPWSIRNKQTADTFKLSSVKDFNLFFYTVPEFLSFKERVTPDTARKELFEKLKLQGVQPEEIADIRNSDTINKISYEYLRQDIFGYAKWHLVKMVPFFLSSGTKNFLYIYNDIVHQTIYKTSNSNMTNLLMRGHYKEFIKILYEQWPITLEQIFWGFVCIFMFVPLFVSKNRIYTLLFLAIIFYLAIPTVPVAYSRFRLPASPYMFLLALAGFEMFYSKIKLGEKIGLIRNKLIKSSSI